ncbi:mitochondrial ribosomal protein subunit-domain-containing protein [Dichomitus squalens]|uniref:Mitochondrial ribosomal protein subunit-domain-containing protein n=1 Tax=Dichomitus squalens TaxID=114155 RepID=A0A4Q9N4L5_9APHY|nr:mitochondrial ribosomal protein subunit-domain-containing protein [Dichomitus squalens]
MATPPPSQFAALLRRSKFASYDPHIGQVYTAFDGHAARGNFGLKRPLALRRRNAHITVQAVDSREQQTVWRSAEQENRWIRMWDEVGVRPKLENLTKWEQKVGTLGAEVSFLADSEFVHQETVETQKEDGLYEELAEEEEEELVKKSYAVPNLDAMSEKEFEQYLEHLRSLRPAFHNFLRKKYKNHPISSKTLFQHSLRGGDDFREFLESHAYQEYHKKHPRYIEQQPHRYAGLSYSHAPDVQTFNTTKPHVGRILGDPGTDRQAQFYAVASAGMTSRLTVGSKGEEGNQIITLRFTGATLDSTPEVVGARPEGLEGASLRTSVRIDGPIVPYKSGTNPHPPGTREYVAYLEKKQRDHSVSMTSQPRPKQVDFTPQDHNIPAQRLLNVLHNMSFKE